MRNYWLRGTIVGVGLLLSAVAWADGVILNGLSPRSLSRGGTNLGHSDNGAILHDNPAAMVNMAGEGLFDVGVVGLLTNFGYSDPYTNSRSTDFCPLPQVSLMKKSADGIWAYGFGIFAPAGFSESYSLNRPLLGAQQYESFGALAKVLPGLSCRVTEKLAVGGTFGVGICYTELKGPYVLQGPNPFAGTPILLNAHNTGATPVWSLGLQYDLTESTTVGLTYISQSRFTLHGNTRVTLPPTFTTTVGFDSALQMNWPDSLGLGVKQELSERTTASADLIYYGWSNAFQQLSLTLSNPTLPFAAPLQENLPLNWRDSLSVRLGLEHRLESGNTLRCGYVNHRNPVPASTITPYIQATLQHAFSVGYGTTWNDWEVDLGYMYLFGPTQSVGTSSLVGNDFGNSQHDAQIHAIFCSFIKPF